jgi:hypothetical protein
LDKEKFGNPGFDGSGALIAACEQWGWLAINKLVIRKNCIVISPLFLTNAVKHRSTNHRNHTPRSRIVLFYGRKKVSSSWCAPTPQLASKILWHFSK